MMGTPSATWEYRTETGQVSGYVRRWNKTGGGKEIRPLSWCLDASGNGRWVTMALPGNRPLYGAHLIADRPDARVLLVEGEKAADAARRFLPDWVVLTWQGGAMAVPKTDWAPLKGRDVTVWPDADDPGMSAAQEIAYVLPGSRILTPPADVERKWDLADAEVEGWTAARVEAHIRKESNEVEASHWAPKTRPPAALDGVILPCGEVSITDCAEVLYDRLKKVETLFIRGGEIAETIDIDGVMALDIISPDAFRSRSERVGPLLKYVSGREGGRVLKQTQMSRDQAAALMACEERRRLPCISSVLRCPVIVRRDGKPAVLGKGYHHDGGGTLVAESVDVSEWSAMPLNDAVENLLWIVRQIEFQSEGDKARAVAALITPALRMGGLLTGPVPIDVAEADQSQAGKGYRHQLVACLYNEKAYLVTTRNGGVGSADESFAQALVGGRPFICLDNLRGRLDSQMLESFLTAPGLFGARVPHRGEVQVDAKRFLLQLSSNGMEATSDLANRSSICRIRKRPGFDYEDTLSAIQEDPGRYLASVFRIVAEWIKHGCPRTKDRRHDFVEWAQSLDWIVRNLIGLAPLMDGHQSAQERTSNPALTWLRAVALAAEKDARLGTPFSASNLVEICGEHGIEIKGGTGDDKKAAQSVGMTMGRLFGNSLVVDVDGFRVERGTVTARKPCGDESPRKVYTFTRDKGAASTQPPNSTQPSLSS